MITAVNTRLFSFIGGQSGPWRVVSFQTVAGEALAGMQRLDVVNGPATATSDAGEWVLRGLTSHERYVVRQERDLLVARQPSLGRSEATCAALIPIRKTAAWWRLAQDERRRIFEDSSHHIERGLKVLPAVARRLHHCRDLGENEPFDFLTWFEFAPSDAAAFEALVADLRATEEWAYVDREIDIRLVRERV
jgi:hypothetical protein